MKYLGKVKKGMETPPSRYLIYSFVSFWKMCVFFGSMVFIEMFISRKTSQIFSLDISKFKTHHIMNFNDILLGHNLTEITGMYGNTLWPFTPFYMLIIQSSAAFLCFSLGKMACKLNIQVI